MSNDAAGFASASDRPVAPPCRAFDTGLRPGPFPDRAASLLPGLLAATRTGLPPAGDDELTLDQVTSSTTSNHWAHSARPCIGRRRLRTSRLRIVRWQTRPIPRSIPIVAHGIWHKRRRA